MPRDAGYRHRETAAPPKRGRTPKKTATSEAELEARLLAALGPIAIPGMTPQRYVAPIVKLLLRVQQRPSASS